MVQTIHAPKIPRMEAWKLNLLGLRKELADYWWDGNVDMLEHVIKINKMIQHVIWEGYLMKNADKIEALRNTLPKELHTIIDDLWEFDECSTIWFSCRSFFEKVYKDWGNEDTHAMNLTWHKSVHPVMVFPWLPNSTIKFPWIFTSLSYFWED